MEKCLMGNFETWTMLFKVWSVENLTIINNDFKLGYILKLELWNYNNVYNNDRLKVIMIKLYLILFKIGPLQFYFEM